MPHKFYISIVNENYTLGILLHSKEFVPMDHLGFVRYFVEKYFSVRYNPVLFCNS